MFVQEGVKERQGAPVVGLDARQGKRRIAGHSQKQMGAPWQQQQHVVFRQQRFCLEAQRSALRVVVCCVHKEGGCMKEEEEKEGGSIGRRDK